MTTKRMKLVELLISYLY